MKLTNYIKEFISLTG